MEEREMSHRSYDNNNIMEHKSHKCAHGTTSTSCSAHTEEVIKIVDTDEQRREQQRYQQQQQLQCNVDNQSNNSIAVEPCCNKEHSIPISVEQSLSCKPFERFLAVKQSSVLLINDVVLFENTNVEGQWTWSVGTIINVCVDTNVDADQKNVCGSMDNIALVNRTKVLPFHANDAFMIEPWKITNVNDNNRKSELPSCMGQCGHYTNCEHHYHHYGNHSEEEEKQLSRQKCMAEVETKQTTDFDYTHPFIDNSTTTTTITAAAADMKNKENAFARCWNEECVTTNNVVEHEKKNHTNFRASLASTSLSSEPMALSSSASTSSSSLSSSTSSLLEEQQQQQQQQQQRQQEQELEKEEKLIEQEVSKSRSEENSSLTSSTVQLFSSSAPRKWLFAKENTEHINTNERNKLQLHDSAYALTRRLEQTSSTEWENLLNLPFTSVPLITRQAVTAVLYLINILDLATAMNAINTSTKWEMALQCIREGKFTSMFKSFSAFAAAEGGLDVHITANTLHQIKCRLANVKDVLLPNTYLMFENACAASALTADLLSWLHEQVQYFEELVKRRSVIEHVHRESASNTERGTHTHTKSLSKKFTTAVGLLPSHSNETQSSVRLKQEKYYCTDKLMFSSATAPCAVNTLSITKQEIEQQHHNKPQEELLEYEEQEREQPCSSLTFINVKAHTLQPSIVKVNRSAIFCRVNENTIPSVALEGSLTLTSSDLLWLYHLTHDRERHFANDEMHVNLESNADCTEPLPLNRVSSKAKELSLLPTKEQAAFMQDLKENQVQNEQDLSELCHVAVPTSVKIYTIPANYTANNDDPSTISTRSNVNNCQGNKNDCNGLPHVIIKPCPFHNSVLPLSKELSTITSQKRNTCKPKLNIISKLFTTIPSRLLSLHNFDNAKSSNYCSDICNNVYTGVTTNRSEREINEITSCNSNAAHHHTLSLYRADGIPSIQSVAIMMEMLYDEHFQRTTIILDEMQMRLTKHEEYGCELQNAMIREKYDMECKYIKQEENAEATNALERVKLLESALRNNLASSYSSATLELYEEMVNECKDIELMSTAHKYADKLEEARFQIRVKHHRHLRAIDELQQAQTSCTLLLPLLAVGKQASNITSTNNNNNNVNININGSITQQESKEEYNAVECAVRKLCISIDNVIDLLLDDGCESNEPHITSLPWKFKKALSERFCKVQRAENRNMANNVCSTTNHYVKSERCCCEDTRTNDNISNENNQASSCNETTTKKQHAAHTIDILQRSDAKLCTIEWQPQSELDNLKAEVQKMRECNAKVLRSNGIRDEHHFTSAHL